MTGEEYDAFVSEFIEAAVDKYGETVMLQVLCCALNLESGAPSIGRSRIGLATTRASRMAKSPSPVCPRVHGSYSSTVSCRCRLAFCTWCGQILFLC